MRIFNVLVVMLLVTGCASVGPGVEACGVNDVPIMLTESAQAALSDQEVKDILSYNEALVDRGCAKPN